MSRSGVRRIDKAVRRESLLAGVAPYRRNGAMYALLFVSLVLGLIVPMGAAGARFLERVLRPPR